MDLSVIIVSWNVRELLERCLSSLDGSYPTRAFEVFVVDNGSHDGTVSMVRSKFPRVHIQEMGRNVGFAAACNRALREAQGRYILILNPDTEVTPDCLEKLILYAESHPEVGMIAPKIVNTDMTFQVGSIRRNPTIASQALMKLLHLPRVWTRIPALRSYLMLDFNHNREQDIEQIAGAAMFIASPVLRQVGFFDERFFLWFEDVDLCLRFQKAGERIQYYPDAVIIHHGAQSFQQRLPLYRQWQYNVSCIKYFRKHRGVVVALFLVFLLPFNMVGVFLAQVFRFYGRP